VLVVLVVPVCGLYLVFLVFGSLDISKDWMSSAARWQLARGT
jgi:hypothetical protein